MADVNRRRSGKRRTVAQPKSTQTAVVCYIEPSPLAEVLTEQLEYLVAHVAEAKCEDPACDVCARYDRAAAALLGPFRKPAKR